MLLLCLLSSNVVAETGLRRAEADNSDIQLHTHMLDDIDWGAPFKALWNWIDFQLGQGRAETPMPTAPLETAAPVPDATKVRTSMM